MRRCATASSWPTRSATSSSSPWWSATTPRATSAWRLVKGFGLKRGAFASSVAHDAHNIVVVGANDADMLCAVDKVVAMQGGLAVCEDGRVLEALPLSIAGLMSQLPIAEVDQKLTRLEQTIAAMGGTLAHPFMMLAFMPLSVIPALKLTDRGLVDVNRFAFVPVQDPGE